MKESDKRWAFWALSCAFLVDFLGYAFIVPILPSWKQEFALSNTEATALVSLWAVPLFLLGPKTGRLTDRLGAGRTILFSLFCLTVASLMYLVAMRITVIDGFIVLAIARLIHGLSGAAILTAGFAAASDIWPTNFGEISGKLIAMATIGGLLGPVIGGVAYTMGPEYAFIGLALITAAIIPIVYVTTKELGQGGEPAQGSVPLKVFIQNPVLFRIGLLVTMTTLATGALEAGIPLFLEDNLGLNAAWIGAVLLVMVIAQGIGGWMWGTLVDKNGPVIHGIWLVYSDGSNACCRLCCLFHKRCCPCSILYHRDSWNLPICHRSSSSSDVAYGGYRNFSGIRQRWSRFGIRCFWHRMGCWNHNRTNGNRSCFRLYWVLGNYAWNTCNTDVLWLANHSHE